MIVTGVLEVNWWFAPFLLPFTTFEGPTGLGPGALWRSKELCASMERLANISKSCALLFLDFAKAQQRFAIVCLARGQFTFSARSDQRPSKSIENTWKAHEKH